MEDDRRVEAAKDATWRAQAGTEQHQAPSLTPPARASFRFHDATDSAIFSMTQTPLAPLREKGF